MMLRAYLCENWDGTQKVYLFFEDEGGALVLKQGRWRDEDLHKVVIRRSRGWKIYKIDEVYEALESIPDEYVD